MCEHGVTGGWCLRVKREQWWRGCARERSCSPVGLSASYRWISFYNTLSTHDRTYLFGHLAGRYPITHRARHRRSSIAAACDSLCLMLGWSEHHLMLGLRKSQCDIKTYWLMGWSRKKDICMLLYSASKTVTSNFFFNWALRTHKRSWKELFIHQ